MGECHHGPLSCVWDAAHHHNTPLNVVRGGLFRGSVERPPFFTLMPREGEERR